MCTSELFNSAASASATTGSGAPYAFGSASTTPSVFTPGNANLALGTASGAVSLFGALTSANNQKTADEAQAATLQQNAINAEQAAASAVTTGVATAANTYQKGAQTKASQTTAMAANGIDVSAPGTAQNVINSTNYITQQNVDTITANAARAAMGYTQQEQADITNSAAYKAAGSSINPLVTGATSLLGSATSVASNWYRNQKVGVS